MWKNIIELSQLEIFSTEDHMGLIAFVVVLIIVIIGFTIILKFFIQGTVTIWNKTFDTIKSINEDSKKQTTERIRVTGVYPPKSSE